jgi:hypothetical protein
MVYIINSPVITAPGVYFVRQAGDTNSALTMTLDEIRALLKEELKSNNVTSAVGHEASAKALETVLDIPVPVNRIEITAQPGDTIIAMKLHKRLPEGKVLSLEELNELGFTLFVITLLPGRTA